MPGMRPIRYARVTNEFGAPGPYNSLSDAHGRAGHHTGIDFGDRIAPSFQAIDDLPVRSSLPGVVVISERNSWAGEWVGVYNADEDVTITYWHLSVRRVAVGAWVGQGHVLGHVGTTGNSNGVHLHVQANRGRGFNYHAHVDPRKWCLGMRVWWPAFLKARVVARRKARSTHPLRYRATVERSDPHSASHELTEHRQHRPSR